MQDLTWTKIEPTWDVDRVRKEAAKLIIEYKIAMSVAAQEDEDILEKMQNVFYADIVKQLAQKGISTPIALVRYLAELTVNLGGGSVSISGDDKEATIQYDELPGLEDLKEKMGLTSPQKKTRMLEIYEKSLNRFSSLLGLKASVEVDFDKPFARIKFRK